MPFFSKVFRSKDSSAAKKQAKENAAEQDAPQKPQWTDAWLRTEVSPEEVQELLRGCTQELKARGLSTLRRSRLHVGKALTDLRSPCSARYPISSASLPA